MSVFSASRTVLLLCALISSVALSPAQTIDGFFDRQTLHEIRLEMLPADWQALHEHYMDDTSYPCKFSWNGYELARIGIKSRGSQSRSPIKPSIGLDFSKYVSTQRFAGLKTLVMRNLNQDASMMHEWLAEAIFARLGLPHSREAYARLYVNGEYAGVYLMVEPIDARFVKVRLGEDTGYLYDMQDTDSPYHFEYLGPDLTLYIPGLFDPKTNTSAPDAAGIEEMIRQINEVHDIDFVATVNRYVDLNAAVAHVAAETAVSNWDGVVGINGMRNFYFYRWQGSKRGVFLGWDMDAAFSDFSWPLFEYPESNVLFRRALQSPELRRQYLEAIDSAAHVMGDGDWLAHEIATTYNLIRQAAYDDPYKLCRVGEGIGRCTNEMFDGEVQHLLQFAYVRPGFIWKVLASEFSHDSAAPDLRPGQTVELGSEMPALAPESLATVKTPLSLSGPMYATGYPLPRELAGIRVETDSGDASLIEVCETGITFVVPASLPCGPGMLRVLQNGHLSNSILVDVRPTATVVFAATHADGTLVTPDSPAVAGEWIVLYATGVWPGQIAQPPAALTITVNGSAAKLVWAGLAPGLVGMQQLILEVPNGVGAAGLAQLVILVDGESGRPFQLPVRQ